MSNYKEAVKELRKMTGASMAVCIDAAKKSDGDIKSAIDIIRKAGLASAEKKTSRATGESRVFSYEDDSVIALMDVSAETDFVTRSDAFGADITSLLKKIIDKGISVDNEEIQEIKNSMIGKFGENIVLGDVSIIKKDPKKSYGIYDHLMGRMVSAVELSGNQKDDDFAKVMAIQIAGVNPEYLRRSDVPEEIVAKEREYAIASAGSKAKNEIVLNKIIEGRLNKFYGECCLLEHPFMYDDSKTVESALKEKGGYDISDFALVVAGQSAKKES